MALGSIPTEYVVLATAILSGLIYYQSRLNGLDSELEREMRINARLKDRSWFGDSWGITIDSIRLSENGGFPYRIKKFITGNLNGESIVTVRYENGHIPENFWNESQAQQFLDEFDFTAEHLRTRTDLSSIVAQFKFGSMESSDISGFFMAVIQLTEYDSDGS